MLAEPELSEDHDPILKLLLEAAAVTLIES